MIDELYASAERSPLSSMMVRLASVFLRAVAVLLFAGGISLLFIAISGLVGKLAFYFTGMDYGQEIWFLTGAIVTIMVVSTFFLLDFILTKLLERFGFSWTIFGHKW